MEIKTYCEESYVNVVPFLRAAIIKTLTRRGLPVKKAVNVLGVSTTAYERHAQDERVDKIIKDEELGDMVEALASRILVGERIEPSTFCILCAKSRRLFGLKGCTY
ncbi:MAG: transcriptional regulator [Candidatus Aramenus sulfurataquae]|jgi:predicted transcriptional regulator|uniref:Transcriptional regulator n=3 Tax=Candidatus Aramenus sulfurataquae TaxID=1326980 RepID=A0AAE3K2B4_9CREN|nr:transcriptional regulator [Candidatus Aramenus sulfurataquae]